MTDDIYYNKKKLRRLAVALVLAVTVLLSACGQQQMSHVDPTEPVEPTEHVGPTEPVGPTELVSPTEPVGPTELISPTGKPDEPDEQEVFISDKQNFSFEYDGMYSCEWNDDTGAVIYTEYSGSIPYLLVYRNVGNTEGFDPEASMAEVTEQLQAQYGDRFISAGEYREYLVGEKELQGILYTYSLVDGTVIELLRLIEVFPDSLMQYTCKYIQGSSTATIKAMEQAVLTLTIDNGNEKPDAEKSETLPTDLKDISAKPAAPVISGTALYNDGRFSIELPKGWKIATVGEYAEFSFYAYDSNKPERKIFFFCKLEPFQKSEAAKTERQQLAAMVGANDPYGYNVMAAMPTLYPATGMQFLKIYPEIITVVRAYPQWCLQYNFPDLNSMKVLETYASDIPCAPTCLDNSIMRITFTSDNSIECQGLVAAQVTDKISTLNPMTGTDLGFHCVYNFMGITAPTDEFAEIQQTLQKCLSSFTFTQEYQNEAINAIENQTDAIIAQAKSMQAAYDSYNAAWSARQTSYDIISQKNSDATLGYDRLYDPDTGEIYRAEYGFYDSYNANREQYSNSNLQMIDGSTESYYLNGVDYYINK